LDLGTAEVILNLVLGRLEYFIYATSYILYGIIYAFTNAPYVSAKSTKKGEKNVEKFFVRFA
jgi:hypothetical protein